MATGDASTMSNCRWLCRSTSAKTRFSSQCGKRVTVLICSFLANQQGTDVSWSWLGRHVRPTSISLVLHNLISKSDALAQTNTNARTIGRMNSVLLPPLLGNLQSIHIEAIDDTIRETLLNSIPTLASLTLVCICSSSLPRNE